MESYQLIQTPRLDLYCLSVDELETQSFVGRGFLNPHGVFTEENLPRTNRLADVKAHPERIRWYYRIMVDRERNIAVGSISFHASPDVTGMIEIGLGVADAEQGKGFATEALRGMWDWVSNEPEVKLLRYTVSPTNLASMAIIRKFGFPQTGEQIDEEDGLELIFENSVVNYLQR